MLLTELAGRLGVEVRLESLAGDEDHEVSGGLCRLGGRLVAFVDRRLGPAGRNRVLGRALWGLGLEGVYLRPAVRDYLEGLNRPGEGEAWPS
jgi:hypothetical protein